METEDILVLNDLGIGYSLKNGSQRLLHEINISAARGELIALVGRNGVGKSTLLRTIIRVQPSLKGSVIINGSVLRSINRNNLSRLVSFIPAEPVHTPNLSVREFVSLSRYPYHGWFESLVDHDKSIISSSLGNVGIHQLADRELESLSDGERQRAMIAFAIAQDTEIILMDEPTAFLDLPTKFEIVNLLRGLADQGKTIIFSTHDLSTAFKEVDKLWLMLEDQFLSGSPEALALDGSVNKFLKGTSINFDIHNGTFTANRKYKSRIFLDGIDDIQLFWTKHALNRIGFEVLSGKQDLFASGLSICSIQCINEGQGYSWIIHQEGHQTIFTHISGLINHCKKLFDSN